MNIYKVLLELTDKRAQRVHGVQDVHHIVQGNHMLNEPKYNQIPVELKFVRPSNFKTGLRRKFFLFSGTQHIKEDEDLTQKPKNVRLKHLARGGPWIKTNLETYQKDDTSSLHPELSSGRLRRKQEPKRLRPVASGGAGGPVFGQGVNPVSTRGADYAHHSNASSPGFSDLATALRLQTQHIMREYFKKFMHQ